MINYSIALGNLGNTCDRFLSSGYKTAVDSEQQFEIALKIPFVTGVELVGSWDITRNNVDQIKRFTGNYNLKCVSIIPDLFAVQKYGKGSLIAKDPTVRKDALNEIKSMMDISVHLPEYIELLLWLKKTGYNGWYSMDQYPYRENAFNTISESVLFLHQIDQNLTLERIRAFESLIADGDATAVTKFIREVFLK